MAERQDYFLDAEPGISIRPLLQKLWRYRRTIAFAFGALVAVTAALVIIAYLAAPRTRQASLHFHLAFDGADRNQFPNGLKFSITEIVATQVLTEVYTANDLKTYFDFAAFKESMFVLEANTEVDLLALEYQAKLSDPKLTPIDRSRLEEEFRKRRETLKSADYSINFVRTERTKSIPSAIMGKVLQDTLMVWARQAVERKGVLRYNVPMQSRNVFGKDFLAADNDVIAADILRTRAARVMRSISRMIDLPGALALRIGKENTSLTDVRTKVEDVLQFKIEPLFDHLRATRTPKQAAETMRYFEGRLFQTSLDRDEAERRQQILQEGLRAYLQKGVAPAPAASKAGSSGGSGTTTGSAPADASVVPQLGESFIDKVMSMANPTAENQYRMTTTEQIIGQGNILADLNKSAAYYKGMRDFFSTPGGETLNAAQVKMLADTAFNEISTAMENLDTMFAMLAEQNLNPAGAAMFSLTSPVLMESSSSLTLRIILFFVMTTLLAGLIIIPLLCLAHAYFREYISAKPAPRSNPLAGV